MDSILLICRFVFTGLCFLYVRIGNYQWPYTIIKLRVLSLRKSVIIQRLNPSVCFLFLMLRFLSTESKSSLWSLDFEILVRLLRHCWPTVLLKTDGILKNRRNIYDIFVLPSEIHLMNYFEDEIM